MTLKEHIDDIHNNLEQGLFISEAAVSDSIVRRLFDALGWPIYNPQFVFPQYPVEGGKVDFALCHPSSEPRVFIEVKQVGNIDGAEEQLFRYAFHKGVPIAILTDGQKWRFFHPTGEGEYRDRRVHELDLIEGDSQENSSRLNRYLNYQSIRTGEAIRAIKDDYENVLQQRQIEAHLPRVWSELVQEKNEYLLLAVMEKAKNRVGYEPTEEQVLDFLKSLERVEFREKPVHSSPVRMDNTPKRIHKRYVKEDGSAEWTTRGKHRVVSTAIIAEMQRVYHESVARGDGAVKYPMEVLVRHGIVEDTNYDKDGNWNAVAKIVGHERKMESHLREVPPAPTPKPFSTVLNPRSKTQSKAPAKGFVVTMPNGEVIRQHTAIRTFVEVIERLIREYGEEAVLHAAEGHPIISTSSFDYPGKLDKRLGRFYISTNHGAKAKKAYLDYIASRLHIQLKVEIVEKS